REVPTSARLRAQLRGGRAATTHFKGTAVKNMKNLSLARSSSKPSLVRRIWRRTAGDRSWTARFGDFRERELYGLIPRANYMYGMLRAADVARFFGRSHVTACEFGVATGMGLTNMVEVAEQIEAETGVRFR